MALHLVNLVFAGEVPTLNSYSRTWGEEFRLSALSDVRQMDQRRGKGLSGSPLVRIVINLFPPYQRGLLEELAGKIEESLLLPGSGQGKSVEIEIVMPDRTERVEVVPQRYADLESVRELCARLGRFANPQ